MNRAPSKVGEILLSTAAFVIVVAGMRAAESILVPFILSIFIAVMCAPPLFWLKHKKVPEYLAIPLLIVAVVGIFFLIGALVGTSVQDFSRAAPGYQARLTELTAGLFAWLEAQGIAAPRVEFLDYFNLGAVMKVAANTFSEVGSVLGNTFLIVLTVVFLLLEAAYLPGKLRMALSDAESSFRCFEGFTASLQRYVAIKTVTSLITGVVVSLFLTVIGVDFAVLWGLLAFLLNYVPNIGSIIAAVPAVLLALIQMGGGGAAAAACSYVVVNVVIGSVLEPRFMGRGLGLSPLVVFLSLIFWGWVWGAVGMLLSVPLTMIVKIALESREDTRWIGVLLGSERK